MGPLLCAQNRADCQWTSEGFDLKGLRYHDYRLRGERLQALPDYRRHALTDSGISPLAVPGDSPHLVVTDSDEHDEKGHIIEDAETRQAMVRKRLHKKMALLGHEISPPTLYGDPKAEVVLKGWGSTYGVIKECVDALSKERSVAMLHFSEVYPFPSAERFDFLSVLKNAGLAISIENNATSQFARLVRAETGFTFGSQIHRVRREAIYRKE